MARRSADRWLPRLPLMASIASRPPLLERVPFLRGRAGHLVLPALVVLGLLVVSLVLRTRALGDSLWMDVFGDGPAETQGLSLAISLLAIPGGLWAGWSLFGRRAGLILAALCALNPFLTSYAQETRMYSLMLVLSLLATAAFLHVFAFGRRSYLPAFSVLLALMLYTHNWGLFLGVGLVCALVPCWYVSEIRSSFWKDALLGFGGAGP